MQLLPEHQINDQKLYTNKYYDRHNLHMGKFHNRSRLILNQNNHITNKLKPGQLNLNS